MGHLLPIPQDGGDGSTDDPNAQLKLDLAARRQATRSCSLPSSPAAIASRGSWCGFIFLEGPEVPSCCPHFRAYVF